MVIAPVHLTNILGRAVTFPEASILIMQQSDDPRCGARLFELLRKAQGLFVENLVYWARQEASGQECAREEPTGMKPKESV
jgi:hypothetical protein